MPPERPVLDPARILVMVCTYDRPDGLAAFLDTYLADPTTLRATLLVVDNNPDGRAAATVTAASSRAPGRSIVYAHEPRPGIAAARNRCLDHVTAKVDAFVFVDDDELVPPGWLGALLGAAHDHDADIVNGNVETVLPPDAPGWVRRSGLFERRRRPTGSSEGLPATNNTLVRREAWSARARRASTSGSRAPAARTRSSSGVSFADTAARSCGARRRRCASRSSPRA